MKFEQIAVVADREFKTQLPFMEGASAWTRDIVTAKGILVNAYDQVIPIHNRAELRFNYDVFTGKEFELIHYIDGHNYLGHRIPGTLSHFGVHVPDIDMSKPYLEAKGFKIVQEVVTVNHSNTNVPLDRHYRYAIFRHPDLHYFWKLIQRLTGTEWLKEQESLEARYHHDIF
jgi:hypothetical protein